MTTEEEQTSNERGGYLFTYVQIVFNQVRRLAILENDPPKDYQGWMLFTQSLQIESEKRECKILAVISTALFLEAYIYDYAARMESASYVDKYLDKLDPVAKWAVIPRLLSPPGLARDSDAFGRLKRLFKLRNDLVHHKTKAGGSIWQAPEPPDDLPPIACLNLMCELLEMLIEHDPEEEIAKFILRHVASWVEYSGKDIRFYPIAWEA